MSAPASPPNRGQSADPGGDRDAPVQQRLIARTWRCAQRQVRRLRVLAGLLVSLGLASVAIATAMRLSDASEQQLPTQRLVDAAALGFVIGLSIVLLFGVGRREANRGGPPGGAFMAAYYVLLVIAAIFIYRLTLAVSYDLSIQALITGLLGVTLVSAGLVAAGRSPF